MSYEITDEDIENYVLLKVLSSADEVSIGFPLDKLYHIGKDIKAIDRFFDDAIAKNPELTEKIKIEMQTIFKKTTNRENLLQISLSQDEKKTYKEYMDLIDEFFDEHEKYTLEKPSFRETLMTYIIAKALAEFKGESVIQDKKFEGLDEHIDSCENCQKFYKATIKAAPIIDKDKDD